MSTSARRPPVRGETEGNAASLPRGALRIQTVASLTGVAEATLRAWERRYGVPSPERTASNYRLYGPRDVEQVREMRRLCNEGVAAAEAARRVLEGAIEAPLSERPAADSFASAVLALTDAIRRLDDVAFEEHLRRASYLGPSTTIVDRVCTPTLVRVDALLRDGHLSIAQEHFASQRIATLIRDFTRLVTHDEPQGAAIIACFADEEHEIGALGVALRLATWGLRPVFLGARTPPAAIRTAVEYLAPRLVALSITVAPDRARARELVDGYAGACGSTPWTVGGLGVDSMVDLVRNAGGILAPPDSAGLRAIARLAIARPHPRRGKRGQALPA